VKRGGVGVIWSPFTGDDSKDLAILDARLQFEWKRNGEGMWGGYKNGKDWKSFCQCHLTVPGDLWGPSYIREVFPKCKKRIVELQLSSGEKKKFGRVGEGRTK